MNSLLSHAVDLSRLPDSGGKIRTQGFISVKSSATLNPVLTELTQSSTVGVCFPLPFLNLTVSLTDIQFSSHRLKTQHTKVSFLSICDHPDYVICSAA